VAARADDGRDAPVALATRTTRPTPVGRREAYFGPAHGRLATPVVDRAALAETGLRGPLIIEEYEGTTVVPPGDGAALDRFGNIAIEVAP